MTNTLIGDADGIYHPSLFNDRLLLGLKGTMSEAELHVLRARLDGGIRNKAARGELRRGLPVGVVWGEADGEVLFHPDEVVRAAVRAVCYCIGAFSPYVEGLGVILFSTFFAIVLRSVLEGKGHECNCFGELGRSRVSWTMVASATNFLN